MKMAGLKSGTSDRTKQANVLELRRQGHAETQAREIADKHARQSVNKPVPKGTKPQYSR